MITKSLLPPATIAAYVSSILTIEYTGGIAGFTIPLYANGSPALLFHDKKPSDIIGESTHLSLLGQTILPGQLSFNGSVTLVAYFFHPHGLKALFGIDAGELTDKKIDLNYLELARQINLQEQLLNAETLNNRLEILNSFILNLSAKDNYDNARLTFATSELKRNNNPNVLSEIQAKLNTSERSLQRLFESNVGISPKMFKRVWQFHNAFQQLNKYQFDKLTDVAYQHGFADQSHFIRVFKEFTDLTPKEYLQMAAPYNPKF